jgi:hypothetical protein
MKNFRSLSVRSLSLLALFVLALLAGTGPLASAQEAVQGTMTLPVAARLGNTMLPPGEYKFTVSLIGDTRAIRDVAHASHVYVLLVGTAKDAPVVSAIAMASPLDAHSPMPANFISIGDSLAISALPLPEFGIVVQFFGTAGKEALHASDTQPPTGVMSAKAN